MYLFQDLYRELVTNPLTTEKYKAPLIPITTNLPLCPEFFKDELRAGLRILLDEEDFVTEDEANKVCLVLNPLLEFLAIYYSHNPAGAKDAATVMIGIFEDLATEDDYFPRMEVEWIKETVSSPMEKLDRTDSTESAGEADVDGEESRRLEMISFYPLKDRFVSEIEYQHYGEIFGNPVPIEFEIDLLRIDRTYVIEKSRIKSFQLPTDSDEARFIMKDGSTITLKLVPAPAQQDTTV